jgi:hypothetical protein
MVVKFRKGILKMKIAIIVNEDGYGTSSWAMRLAKELYRHPKVSQIWIIFATKKREDFHRDKYASPYDSKIKLVRLNGVENRIELVKQSGAVDVAGSINRCIIPYTLSRDEYEKALMDKGIFEEAELLIDFGVPQAVRANYRENLRKRLRPQSQETKVVTVFDHAWSHSLSRIISSDKTRNGSSLEIQDALTDIQNDEALTQEIFLFGEPICPVDYHVYWKRILGQSPVVIPGSLGGPLSTIEYVGDPAFEDLYHSLKEGGQCKQEVYKTAREYARKLLGIEDNSPTLFVSGAGTPVWDGILKDMVDSYIDQEPNYNVVISSQSEAGRRQVEIREESVRFGHVERKIRRGKYGKLIFLGEVIGDGHPILFPGFELVLTRAGGGTVNDAISARVPLILVEEPGHWQVESIRQACLNMEIAQAVSLEEFQKGGRACVETNNRNLKSLDEQKGNMKSIPNHGEIWLAQELVKLVDAGAIA